MKIKSLALPFLLGLSLICACTTAFGVEHPDGSFATPNGGDSDIIGFKHIDNTNGPDFPYGFVVLDLGGCDARVGTGCVTDCTGVIPLGTATLTSIPTTDIAVSSLVFNTVGTFLTDATSNFCAVLDGADNVWAIDRDLPALSNITTANSSSRIIPCKSTDIFSPVNGCLSGVTDGGVTAYRLQHQQYAVVFTDNPTDSPSSINAPLGAAFLSVTSCFASIGTGAVKGLVCSGITGEPVANYSCTAINSTLNASNTTWCLFSENPRTGGKAWAVKYVNGDIPTNDGASIVRCEGTDQFDPAYGCWAIPSQISTEGGYFKMDTTDGSVPPSRDCTVDIHYGRMVVDDVSKKLYICTAFGWKSTDLN